MLSRAAMESARDRLLARWSDAVTARPGVTIAVCFLLALASALASARFLKFQTDRSDLIDRTLPWQQRYIEFCEKFPRWDDAVIVVDTGGDPHSPTTSAYLDALDARLRADTAHVKTSTAGFPTSQTPPGLLLGEPITKVEDVAAELRRAGPALNSPSLGHLLGLSALGAGLMSERDQADLAAMLRRAARAADDPDAPLLLDVPAVQRLTTPTGRLALVLVELRDAKSESVESEKARGIAALRGHLAELAKDPRFSRVEAGVTGVPVLEDDETLQSMADSSRASVIATVLVAALSIAVYRGVIVPGLIITGLIIGLVASFGWATASVGHLQVLSVVFMVMLVGLGADMTMHLIARLEVVRPRHATLRPALRDSFRAVGPGVITGTVTTAAAFAATGLTEFRGVAELGVIAAGGIIICTVVSLAFFPAALALAPRLERSLRGRDGGVSRPFLGGKLNWVDRRAGLVVIAWALVLAACTPFALRVKYDTDLLKLLPEHLESVRWERRLSADDERSVWHAVVLAKDEGEARRVTAALRASPQVSAVEGAGLLFPADQEAKQAILRAVPAPPTPLPQAEPIDPRPAAGRLAARFGPGTEAGQAAAAVSALNDEQMSRVHAAYGRDRAMLAAQIEAVRTASPPAPGEIPEAIRDQFVGIDGTLLLRVFPTSEGHAPGTSVLSPQRLGPFMEAVLAVAPGATGPTSQIYESARVILSANRWAFVLAAGAILIALLLDFRSIGNTLCAMIPVGVGMMLVLAALGATGQTLNFANTIVAPLIIGLGVTAGVNAVHRWRQQPQDPPAGLAGGAGRAITLTLATTAIGFASMLTAEHRGVRSLGFLMTVGLGAVWVSTVLLLPAVLRLRTDARYDGRRTAGPDAGGPREAHAQAEHAAATAAS